MIAQIAALCIFVLAYVLFVVFPNRRTLVAISASFVLIVSGIIPFSEAFFTAINWNVMGIFLGTLAVADVFMRSRMPAYLAEIIVKYSPSTALAILAICALTGFISAFVENVATVLIIAPIALSLAKKIKLNPVAMMIAIAISSNLQGTATLIGDPPSMLLGGFAKMNFWDFFFYHGKPSIFFAVEIGAILSTGVLYFFFRKLRNKNVMIPVEKVRSIIPTIGLVLLIVALALSSFLDTGFTHMAGIISMVFGVTGLVWEKIHHKNSALDQIRTLDWDTTFFLVGVFILVGTITYTGWTNSFADYLSGFVGTNLLFAYILLIFISMLLSAFIDNVPFLAAMLPIALRMSTGLNIDPSLFLFGILIGASLGGNITPIGASANIVACGLLKKEGYQVSFKEFGRIGIPFTLVAVSAASIFVWFIWGP